MHRLLAFTLCILLSGCAERTPSAADSQVVTPPARNTRDMPREDATPAPPVTAGTAGTAAEAATRLAVDGEGLRLFNVASGAARPIPFDTARSEVLRILTAVQAEPPRELGDNVDCGAQFATWSNGLTVWFVQQRFVGWSIPDGHPGLTTASGLGIGSTREALESAYVAQVGPSTLGVEFTAGGIAGLLDSDRADARVTHLWSGATCIAR